MKMNVLEGFVTAFTRYAEFSGRSSRMEFFPIYLTSHLLMLIYFLFENYIEGFDFIAFIIQFLLIGSLIPTLAAQVRRLHDIDKEGRDFFVLLLPIVGPIFLFMWCCRRGTVGDNRYGPDPLAPAVPQAG
jgi:uncharacterized membrane protein YhaH (DUF805 family)